MKCETTCGDLMNENYRIGALTIHAQMEHPVVGSAVADQFRCQEKGRLICHHRVAEVLQPSTKAELIYKEEALEVYRTAVGLETVRYAHLPIPHPYMISIEHFDGRQVDIVRCAADLSWSSQVSYFWRAMSLRHCLINAGNLLLRAGYVNVGGKGILFAGSAAMEQVMLWGKVPGTVIVNQDRCAIGVEDGKAMAFAVPLLGRGQICRKEDLPLEAVVLADYGKSNSLSAISGPKAMAAMRPFVACDAWRDGKHAVALSLLGDVLGKVSVMEMKCSSGEASVKELAAALGLKVKRKR